MSKDFRKALGSTPSVSLEIPKPKNIIIDKETHEDISNRIADTNSSVGNITSEILYDAPANFFDKYDEAVKDTVKEVRDLIAKDSSSEVIAKVNNDPTNTMAKTKAIDEIKAKISQLNESAKGAKILSKFKSPNDSKIINAMVINEIIGFGPLDPFWADEDVTEIIANGPYDIQVEKNGVVESVPSVHFRDPEHLESLISRLYNSINKSFSRKHNQPRGRLYDKSRIHAVHTVIAPEGPNFNIRRHRDNFISPMDLVKWGAASKELMTDIGNYVHEGLPFVVIGGTGSGKTTLLNALTAFMPNNQRGVILEQNLEMKVHPNKLFAAPMECIEGRAEDNSDSVTMRDLVKAATQMRPEAIYIGEVIDDAAYDLCQALNTGHTGASTVHANDAESAIPRLMSLVSQSGLVTERAAIDLIANAFAITIVTKRFKWGERRIVSVSEVSNKAETDEHDNVYLPTTLLWEYRVNHKKTRETGELSGDWIKVNELSEETKDKYFIDDDDWLSWRELEEIAEVKGDE